MRTIRLSFAWCFVLMALISASVAIKLSSLLIRDAVSPVRAAASTLLMPSLAILYALGSWSIFTRRPSVRVWGTLSSLALAVSLGWPIFFERPLDLFNPIWVLAAGGLAGIVIFARRDTEASRKPPANSPLPGDGTNTLLNKLATLIGVAATTGGIELWAHWARSYDLPDTQGPAFYLGFVIVILLVMVIHEAGHAIAAIAVDMKVISFGIGPFSAWISEGKWKFHFRPAGLLSLLGVIHVVPTTIDNFRRRKIIQIAAGPFTSIATGLIASAILLTAPGHSWEAHWRTLADFANISLVVGLINLVPFGIKGGYSDGAKLYQLRCDGLWAKYQCQLGVYYATAVTSLRPRDFDIETIEQAAGTIARGGDELQMHLCAYTFYLDTDRLAEAELALAKIEKFCDESSYEIPEGWYSMLVFAIGFLRRDAASARLWWERLKAKPSFQFDDSLWDSRCALLLSENRLDEAGEAWEKADTWSRQLPAAGAWDAQRYAVTLLGHALEESRAMSLSPSI